MRVFDQMVGRLDARGSCAVIQGICCDTGYSMKVCRGKGKEFV